MFFHLDLFTYGAILGIGLAADYYRRYCENQLQAAELRAQLSQAQIDSARKQYEGAAEELLRYLLFVDEAPLECCIKGTSGFAEEFVARGPRDARGRSLRDL